MLQQTRRAVENLRRVGLTRKQFRVRTSWNRKLQGYENTQIVLLCPRNEVLQLAPILADHFKTIVMCIDGVPKSVSLRSGHGLFIYEKGEYTRVESLPTGN